MLILIAESKSMQVSQTEPAHGTEPVFNARATEVMASLQGCNVAQLSQRLRLGPKSAQRLFQEVYNYSVAPQTRAINAYTGVVFRTLEAETLTADGRRIMEERVRIISSLYGWLRPSDLVKPYRLDYTMKAAPNGATLAAWWRPTLTPALLREAKGRTVLNLLPGDAAKCLDLKAVQQVAPVYTVRFVQRGEDGTERTPNSDHLKRLRAQLLRHILDTEASMEAVINLGTIDNNRPHELLIKV